MPRVTRESKIFVGNKEFKVDDLLKTIIYLPADSVNQFFTGMGLTIPREIRIYVLRELLREKVAETRKSRLTLADELNYRLSWFAEFSETQFENLLIFYDDMELFKYYLEDLWVELFGYMLDKKVTPLDFKHLYDLSLAHVRNVGLELPELKTYNLAIKRLFFDAPGKIDGLTPERIRPVLYKSSTLGEVREFGLKYDVDVPRRLKKNELAEIIIQEMKDRKEYTEELEKQIKKMSVILMQRFAIDHDIKASTELKKEEIIEYVLSNAKETKESYYTPDSKDVYEEEMGMHEDEKVETEAEQQPQPADVYKPRRSEVQYVQQSVDLSELIREVKLLRQSVEALSVSMKKEESHEEVLVEEQKPMEFEEKDPLIINAAEFYGSSKTLKQAIKEESLEENQMIEEETSQKKEKKEIKPKKDKSEKQPMSKKKAIILWVVVGILSIVLIHFIYAIITYFAPNFMPLHQNWLNQIKISGTGLLDYYHNLLSTLGI
ncbi:MAG: hypothetical protein V3569_00615 [Acholeplasmataceae bacterium]|nr:hypothetical protein [Acholeplasmataceae bacterium]